jgi:hypothetical protein
MAVTSLKTPTHNLSTEINVNKNQAQSDAATATYPVCSLMQ